MIPEPSPDGVEISTTDGPTRATTSTNAASSAWSAEGVDVAPDEPDTACDVDATDVDDDVVAALPEDPFEQPAAIAATATATAAMLRTHASPCTSYTLALSSVTPGGNSIAADCWIYISDSAWSRCSKTTNPMPRPVARSAVQVP